MNSNNINLSQFIQEQSSDTAYINNNNIHSYTDLKSEITYFFNKIKKLKIKKKTLVAITALNNPNTVAILYALWASHLTPVLISPKKTKEQISILRNHYNIDSYLDKSFFDNSTKENIIDNNIFKTPINSDDIAIVIFTSGSSNLSKGCKLSFKNLITSALGTINFYNISKNDIWDLSLSLAHIGGVMIPIRMFMVGGSIIYSYGTEYNCYKNTNSTFISLVPTQLKWMLDSISDLAILKSCRCILIGGASISQSLVKLALKEKLNLYLTYGATETCSQVTSTTNLNHLPLKMPLTSGQALENRKIHISKDQIITISGDTIFKGYLNEKNNSTFETGDLGKLDQNSELIIIGRADNKFISGGENITPLDIELAIKEIDGIIEAKIIPVKDPNFGKVAAAYIQTNKPKQQDEIVHILKDKIEKFKIPKYFHIEYLSNMKNFSKTEVQTIKDLFSKRGLDVN